MNTKLILQIFAVLLLGLVLALAILRTDRVSEDTRVEETQAPHEAEKASSRGPHGGWVFFEGGLQVEVAIFEKWVPPQFRVYVTDAAGKPVPLEEVVLRIKLRRLDRVDDIGFKPAGAYLLGDRVVEEPHSFEVEITAEWQGKTFAWRFEQIEARTELSEEAIRNAGIAVAAAGPATLKNIVRLTGEIGLNEEKVAHVVPRLDGVARKVLKDLGDHVRKGEALAILESRELADAKSNYLIVLKQSHLSRADLERESLVYENTSTMLELLDQGTDLDVLYRKLEGLVIGENRSRLLPAYVKFLLTRSAYVREKGLLEKGITSESDYQIALEDYKSAEARYLSLREQTAYEGSWVLREKKRAAEVSELNLETAIQKLYTLGMTKKEIDALSRQAEHVFTQYELKSPFDGIVMRKHITSGEAVKGDDDIFLIADLSDVWVNIAVPEAGLKSLRLGQKVKVVLQNLDLEGAGTLSYIGSVIDEKNRTVTARVVIPNPKMQWRPGSFVTVELVREEKRIPIGIRAGAIQTLRDWSVVFVRYGNQFEARPVELGESDGAVVEVLHGLRKGEQYVVENSFAVKAEIGKSAATHSH
jgi:cobalt-zinc-cadmium efflux system membrane fusion protein